MIFTNRNINHKLNILDCCKYIKKNADTEKDITKSRRNFVRKQRCRDQRSVDQGKHAIKLIQLKKYNTRNILIKTKSNETREKQQHECLIDFITSLTKEINEAMLPT